MTDKTVALDGVLDLIRAHQEALVFVVGRFALALIAGVLFVRAMSGPKRRKRIRWTY